MCRVTGPSEKEVVLSGMNSPSGLGWTRNGDLIVTSILESTVYRMGSDRRPTKLCGPEDHGIKGTNDMATFGSRSYVSCSDWQHEEGADVAELAQPIGKVLMIEHETGACRTVASALRMPNGIAITPDGKTLILAEGFADRVLKFDIESDGSLSNQRVFADIGRPLDGLALDAAGGVWVATGANFQYADLQGRLGEAIEVPGWSCIAPMLGGEDGRTLFMAVSQAEGADDIFNGTARGRIVTTTVAVGAPGYS